LGELQVLFSSSSFFFGKNEVIHSRYRHISEHLVLSAFFLALEKRGIAANSVQSVQSDPTPPPTTTIQLKMAKKECVN